MSGNARHELKISLPSGSVSAILNVPDKILAGITLAHGAGAGMQHRFLSELSASLVQAGFAVLRFNFPYMEIGAKRTDSAQVAANTVAAAVQLLARQVSAPIFAAGKSFGCRMTTTAASMGLLPQVRGIVCYGFPLHNPGAPDFERSEHLKRVPMPMLFLQGTRDEFAELPLIRGICTGIPKVRLHEVQGADHGFKVQKTGGRMQEEIMVELVRETSRFRESLTGGF